MLSYEANISMRSAAKHVISCGKVLPVDQTKVKLNEFQVPSKRESLRVYFFGMVTHKKRLLFEHHVEF